MPDQAGTAGLVLDTSVWINLIATEQLAPIVTALGVPCLVPEQVLSEIRRHPVTNLSFSAKYHPVLSLAPPVAVVALDRTELELFLEIVSAPATDALGDGEAAAIAIAHCRGLNLVIDDRKARRIVRQRFGKIQSFWTVDILLSNSVRSALGTRVADECWNKAKQFGRMHIP
jgi:predicted nucleic acid-binding protein